MSSVAKSHQEIQQGKKMGLEAKVQVKWGIVQEQQVWIQLESLKAKGKVLLGCRGLGNREFECPQSNASLRHTFVTEVLHPLVLG